MIDYEKISASIKFFYKKGFEQIDVPWLIPNHITKITLPKNAKPYSVSNDNDLLGSAEQGFLYLVQSKNLKGKFQAVSPCFRDDIEDDLHQKYFMKNELFWNENVSNLNLKSLIENAFEFYSRYFTPSIIFTGEDKIQKTKVGFYYSNIEVVPMPGGSFDIIDSKFGIELGSYGIRSHTLIGEWIYGTGIAEPRFSKVLKKHESNRIS